MSSADDKPSVFAPEPQELSPTAPQPMGAGSRDGGGEEKLAASSSASEAFTSAGRTSGSGIVTYLRSCLPVNIGVGILRDIRARAPWYWSDWTDAWNYRVLPATALILFAKYRRLSY